MVYMALQVLIVNIVCYIDEDIRKTCPCNEYPLKPHFYTVKLGQPLKNIIIFPMKCSIFASVKILRILHRQVFVMDENFSFLNILIQNPLAFIQTILHTFRLDSTFLSKELLDILDSVLQCVSVESSRPYKMHLNVGELARQSFDQFFASRNK